MQQQIVALPRTNRTSQQIWDLRTMFDETEFTMKEFLLAKRDECGNFS